MHAPSPLMLAVQPDASFAEALTLALQRRGVCVVQARRWPQARLLLSAAPGIRAVIAPCDMEGEGGEPLLVSAARHYPTVTLVATCVATTHDHGRLPSPCTIWRMPFDGQALDGLVA